MRVFIARVLLQILNSRFLNPSPCSYQFVGNADAFSYQHLASEEKQRPGITVKEILAEADIFKSCKISDGGLTVIEAGVPRPADIWDVHQLNNELSPPIAQEKGTELR